jgi:AsmA protein
MPKILKYTLIGLAALLVLLVLAAVILAASFNPNDYKPQIIVLVHDKTQRTLSLPGEIKLTFFPRIGADLGPFSLSERRGQQVFASATHSHVAVALLPLFSRQVIVDRILVDGLTVNLHRYKNNSTNYDDLINKADKLSSTAPTTAPNSPQEKAKSMLLNLGGIAVTNASLTYTDDTQGSKLSAHLSKLVTGPIASGKKSRLELDADLATTPGDFKFKAKLNSALAVDLETQVFELGDLNADVTLPNLAGGTINVSASGKVGIDLEKESVQSTLQGKFDSTSFEARLGMRHFKQPALSFELTLGDLDGDRYLAADKPAPAAASQGSVAQTAEPVIDLSALKTINAKGILKVAKLKIAGIRAADIKLDAHAAAGKLELSPLSATLYEGMVSGNLSAAAGNPQRFAGKLSLRNIRIGPLLKDAMDKDPLDGKGDVALDVVSSGERVSQLKKALNGTASLSLKDGSVKGFNIAAALRKTKSPAAGEEKTDFTELTGSFKIVNGVAHNDDLSAKTPLLRLGGAGDINIGDSTLDYTAKATVVPTLEGQGGPELQALKGLTIPVRLSGPFTKVAWKIETGDLAGNRAKELADDRAKQLKAEAQRRLDEEKAKLQNQLKGLLGR